MKAEFEKCVRVVNFQKKKKRSAFQEGKNQNVAEELKVTNHQNKMLPCSYLWGDPNEDVMLFSSVVWYDLLSYCQLIIIN